MTNLSEEHRAYLVSQAVDPDLAERLGVRTVNSKADMEAVGDDNWVNFANFPAILFPWTGPDGRVMYQARPDNPTDDPNTGRPRKYVFARKAEPVLWALREVDGATIALIVEGTKQGLAAASYAPPGISVYSIAGCRMWQIDGMPIPDLAALDGMKVIVALDADSATNPNVYQAGMELADALAMEGAERVTFTRMPGGGKSGLDDILATRPQDRRTSYLERLIAGAKPKPADRAPKMKGKDKGMPGGEDERITVVVNEDRLDAINGLTDALLKRWNATELFNHGGVISRRKGDAMHPVDKGSFNDLVQVTARTVNKNESAQGTTYSFGWPDAQTMAATVSRADAFASLDQIARAPFVRPDGSIVTEPGYDEATRTVLMPDEAFTGMTVPGAPTQEEIAAARELILTEWLGDFPVDEDSDRANMLALVLTPAIRGMMPRAPMAVVDGLQMGVGKNLLADSILTVYTGEPARPMNFVDDPEELRKQITSAFRTGASFFVFDEAPVLQGAALAQALTAETWQDRILGVSTMANFPNRVTWISLGNNVQVKGDISRRIYRIALRPRYANPQDRKAETFRHPGQSGLDLLSWTRANRKELLTAILTLVRAWYAAGQPYPKRGVSFGSFEIWERMLGGILETAGVQDFLGNLKVWRSESDFDTQYWANHMAWLREQFGTETFRTSDVRNKATSAGTDFYPAPPKLDDTSDKAYGKSLGEAYGRVRGRRYGSLWLDRAGTAHGHVSVYRVFSDDDLPEAGPVKPGPEAPTDPDTDVSMPGPDPAPVAGIVHGGAPGMLGEMERALATEGLDSNGDPLDGWTGGIPTAGVVVFDLETGDVDDQYNHPGPGYTRIGATATDSGEVQAYVPGSGSGPKSQALIPRAVAHNIREGLVITGHNIMAFDLPVLVREGVMTMPDIHHLARDKRLADTILMARYLDPPMAKESGVDAQRKYDLGTLGTKYELGAKLTDVSHALAKKYGGWAAIPIDDSEDGRAFKDYMVQDVELSRGLYRRLLHEVNGRMPEYVVREHRVAAIAAQISVNGFLIDQPLLAERIAEINQRKSTAMAYLSGQHGVPVADAKGVLYKSPLASKAGKEAIGAALVGMGVPEKALWRTPKAKDLQLSAESMIFYGREYGQNRPELRKLCTAVHRIVSARTVYETIQNTLRPDGRVHPKVSMSQATGRWSLTAPGLTVLGKRGGRHVERAVLLPDPGEAIIAADLSQVDMRAVAGLSQDMAYIEMLKSEDPHRELAVALFGSADYREQAKAIGHGWNYGESLRRISEDNEIEPRLVMQFDTSMRERFPRLVEWREEVRTIAASGQLLDNGFGRPMRPDPQRAHTQGPALMGQGAARDLMMSGMLRLPDEILPMLRAQVHDEIVLSVPEADAEEIGRTVVEALSFEWRGVPITADVSRPGKSWAAVYEKG